MWANFLRPGLTTGSSVGSKIAFCLQGPTFVSKASRAGSRSKAGLDEPTHHVYLWSCIFILPSDEGRVGCTPSSLAPKCPLAFTYPCLESCLYFVPPFHPPLPVQAVLLVPESRVNRSMKLCGKRSSLYNNYILKHGEEGTCREIQDFAACTSKLPSTAVGEPLMQQKRSRPEPLGGWLPRVTGRVQVVPGNQQKAHNLEPGLGRELGG